MEKFNVCFTGHRVLKNKLLVADLLTIEIVHFYNKGYRTFISGGACGFDLLAAETVLNIRARFSDIRLLLAVPFEGQSEKYNAGDKDRYNNILCQADKVEILSEKYFKGCYLRRNDWMLNHSDGVIACWDGRNNGGTAYTCHRAALRAGGDFINLYEQFYEQK